MFMSAVKSVGKIILSSPRQFSRHIIYLKFQTRALKDLFMYAFLQGHTTICSRNYFVCYFDLAHGVVRQNAEEFNCPPLKDLLH